VPANRSGFRLPAIRGWFLQGSAGRAVIASGLMALAASVLLISCGTVDRSFLTPPEIEGATYVGNKVCSECHSNYTRVFLASPHSRLQVTQPKMAGLTGCESCHGPGSKHAAGGGGRGKFIVNPGKDAAACFRCHLEVRAEYSLPHHHPVLEGRMNCISCHDAHGSDIKKPKGGLAMARLNENCSPCHRDQTRPFVFEHEALREGCTACHSPHGSVNAKLLLERDANLCLKCHAQVQGTGVPGGDLYIGKVPHSYFIRQGTCWSAGCHTAIHGSNLNPAKLY
jgi:predicted CXXCH cytochrome family protein